jgi:hydroxymethylbilane synthase
MPNLIIGSRGSKLALWQSNWVKDRLEEVYEGLVVSIEVVKTTGDKLTEASLAQIGGKGVFTKEIEEALLDRRVDLAVHSLKDLPTTLPEGLRIAAITEREDVRDALIVSDNLRKYVINSIEDLPRCARVGTSSLRRASQLRHTRPDLQIIELRGNVETRLRKLHEEDYDAIILASAGLKRLGFDHCVATYLPTSEMLPAVGQGALAIETRVEDHRVNMLLEVLNHQPTRYATEAERAVLRSLGGGCAVPIAAFAHFKKNRISHRLVVDALVADVEGRQLIRRQVGGQAQQAEELGLKLAEMLIEAGARDLLPRIGGVQTPDPVQPDPVQPDPIQPADGEVAVEARPETALEIAVMAQVESEPVNDLSAAPEVWATNDALSLQVEIPAVLPAPQFEPEAAGVASVSTLTFESETTSKTFESGTAPTAENGDSTRPLFGRRVIVTRAAKQSAEMKRALEALGAEVVPCPTIEIKEPSSWEQLDRALIHLSWYDWLVFTSVNGVEYFLGRMDALGHGRFELESHHICAVGRKTAEKLESENIVVDLTPEIFTAEALAEEFTRRFGQRHHLYGARMLLPASRTTRDVIRPAMEKIGVYVEVVEAYQTVTPAAKGDNVARLLRDAQADYIIFTSPSTVANLAAILETDHLAPYLANTRVTCIGPITAEAARLHGLTVHLQPEEHTGKAIVTAIAADCSEKRSAAAP